MSGRLPLIRKGGKTWGQYENFTCGNTWELRSAILKKLILILFCLFLPAMAFGAGPKQDVSLTLQWDYPPDGIEDVSAWVFYQTFASEDDETACGEIDGAVWDTENGICLPFQQFLELPKEQDSTTYEQEVDFSDFIGNVLYIAMTAKAASGLQSDYSNVVSKDLTIPVAPVINTLVLINSN